MRDRDQDLLNWVEACPDIATASKELRAMQALHSTCPRLWSAQGFVWPVCCAAVDQHNVSNNVSGRLQASAQHCAACGLADPSARSES